MKTKRLQLLLILSITFALGYLFGSSPKTPISHVTSVTNQQAPASLSSVDFNLFWKTWEKIDTSYYNRKAINSEQMVYGAINGMLATLNDPYTMFLPPTQNKSFQQQLAGHFEGIGAELGLKNKQIVIISPLNGSPAQKAGVKPGDMLLSVNGQSTQGWSLEQTVSKIRGPKGSSVLMTLMHEGDKVSSKVSIVRDTIAIPSVVGWVKKVKDIPGLAKELKEGEHAQDSVSYIQVSQFGDSTNQDWKKVISTVGSQFDQQHAKGIVLDLRNNPGGYLTDATFIASEFLPEGTPVVTEDMGNDNTTTLTVSRTGVFLRQPLIILVNKGSASASEILAGAMRDNKRATLVGVTSFGKGTIQEALDLGKGAGLHVTVARWLTPDGTWVHGKGLVPDTTVALDSSDATHDTQLEKAIEQLVQ